MSGAVKYADVAVHLTVKFQDDGRDSLRDQAHEAADDLLGLRFTMGEGFDGIEILGEIRDTELPAHPEFLKRLTDFNPTVPILSRTEAALPLDVTELRRAQAEAAGLAPWQSFETAPKAAEDECPIPILVRAEHGGRVRVGEAVWLPSYESWRWANDSCSCCWDNMRETPTHWMPMPDGTLPEGDASC